MTGRLLPWAFAVEAVALLERATSLDPGYARAAENLLQARERAAK